MFIRCDVTKTGNQIRSSPRGQTENQAKLHSIGGVRSSPPSAKIVGFPVLGTRRVKFFEGVGTTSSPEGHPALITSNS